MKRAAIKRYVMAITQSESLRFVMATALAAIAPRLARGDEVIE